MNMIEESAQIHLGHLTSANCISLHIVSMD